MVRKRAKVGSPLNPTVPNILRKGMRLSLAMACKTRGALEGGGGRRGRKEEEREEGEGGGGGRRGREEEEREEGEREEGREEEEREKEIYERMECSISHS